MDTGDIALLARVERLYTCILSDMSEEIDGTRLGVGPRIQAVTGQGQAKVAGFAFPARVRRTAARVEIDRLLAMVDAIPPQAIVVVEGDEGLECALWGGLMSAGARRRGARGAVTNGLIRDLAQIEVLAFPVFGTGRTVLDIRGRGEMVEFGTPVTIGGIMIRPGDVIFGDANGVIAIPIERVEPLLARAERGAQAEQATHDALIDGATAGAVFQQYGRF